jgi:hypothetical protein
MPKDVLKREFVKTHLCLDTHAIFSVQDLIDELQEQYPQFELCDINISEEYDGWYFYHQRLETDEEYEARIKPYTAKLKAKEEKERKEYERLKAKFEGK